MGFLRKRFGERSTYNGLAIIGCIATTLAGPDNVDQVAGMIGALYGMYEMMRAEKK